MDYNLELYHHGVKGMRWGVRRYQNKDGSLTPAGQKRYEITSKQEKKAMKLPTKWNYVKPTSNSDAQKKIFLKNAVTAATIAAGEVAVGKLIDKHLGQSTPISKIAKSTAVSAGIDYIANVTMDEVLYVTKGVIRK